MSRLLLALSLLVCPALAAAQSLVYEGTLTDGDGLGVDGVESFVFAVYGQPEGGEPLWTQAIDDVPVVDGAFVVMLGGDPPLDPATFAGPTWLGVQRVGADHEMSPRQAIGDVPAALVARDVTGDIHPRSISVGGQTVVDAEGRVVAPIAPEALDPRLDRDGDGWPDSVEVGAGTDPADPEDAPVDADDDGVADALRGPPGPQGPPGEAEPPAAPPGPIGTLTVSGADGRALVTVPAYSVDFSFSRAIEPAVGGGGQREITPVRFPGLSVGVAEGAAMGRLTGLLLSATPVTARIDLATPDGGGEQLVRLSGAALTNVGRSGVEGSAGGAQVSVSFEGSLVELAPACGWNILDSEAVTGGCPELPQTSGWLLLDGQDPGRPVAPGEHVITSWLFGVFRPFDGGGRGGLAPSFQGLSVGLTDPDAALRARLMLDAITRLPRAQTVTTLEPDGPAGTVRSRLQLTDVLSAGFRYQANGYRRTASVALDYTAIRETFEDPGADWSWNLQTGQPQ